MPAHTKPSAFHKCNEKILNCLKLNCETFSVGSCCVLFLFFFFYFFEPNFKNFCTELFAKYICAIRKTSWETYVEARSEWSWVARQNCTSFVDKISTKFEHFFKLFVRTSQTASRINLCSFLLEKKKFVHFWLLKKNKKSSQVLHNPRAAQLLWPFSFQVPQIKALRDKKKKWALKLWFAIEKKKKKKKPWISRQSWAVV